VGFVCVGVFLCVCVCVVCVCVCVCVCLSASVCIGLSVVGGCDWNIPLAVFVIV